MSGGSTREDVAPTSRRLRADAERNRQALLDAARVALGSGRGSFSLDAVARSAGVGIGTLYRHFPTRETLVTAAYDAEVEDLLAQGERLLEMMPARDALREWLTRFTRFVSTKRGMLDVLRLGVAPSVQRYDVTDLRERMATAIAPVLDAGAREGTLRANVRPGDFVLLVAGALMPTRVDEVQAARLMGLVLDAVTPDGGADQPAPGRAEA